jgi:hypothetical protein
LTPEAVKDKEDFYASQQHSTHSHTLTLSLLSCPVPLAFLLFASLQVWAALAPEAVKDKEAFYASQQRTSSGFMRYAKTTLELLITLTGDREIVSHSIADSSCLRHVLGGGGGVKHMKYITDVLLSNCIAII